MLDLKELQGVADARRAIRAQIKAHDDLLWKSFSRVKIAKENTVTLQGFFIHVGFDLLGLPDCISSLPSTALSSSCRNLMNRSSQP